MAKKKPHQSKSKTVKKSPKSKQTKTEKRKITNVDKRLITKRKDARGRKYFINVQTGKHVSEEEWKHENQKIKHQRAQRYEDQIQAAADVFKPFPDTVSPSGVPKQKITFDPSEYEGESFEVDEFEPYPIEGDDETG